MIAFFDASALIVVLEGRESWVHGVKQALIDLVASDPGMGMAVSRLSWLECRVGPLRRRDPATLATFDAFSAVRI